MCEQHDESRRKERFKSFSERHSALKRKSTRKKAEVTSLEESLMVLHKKQKKLKLRSFDLFIDAHFFIRNLKSFTKYFRQTPVFV